MVFRSFSIHEYLPQPVPASGGTSPLFSNIWLMTSMNTVILKFSCECSRQYWIQSGHASDFDVAKSRINQCKYFVYIFQECIISITWLIYSIARAPKSIPIDRMCHHLGLDANCSTCDSSVHHCTLQWSSFTLIILDKIIETDYRFITYFPISRKEYNLIRY